jgi:anti-sigma B factor antagonist
MKLADLDVVRDGPTVIARIDGEIDLSNANELAGLISNGVPNDALLLVIDLTGVVYVDSAGIHVLFELRDRLKTRGQEIRLVVPAGSEIFEALRVVYLPSVVAVFESVDAARASLPDKPGSGH